MNTNTITTVYKSVEQNTYQIQGEPYYDHQRGWQLKKAVVRDEKKNQVIEGMQRKHILSFLSSKDIK